MRDFTAMCEQHPHARIRVASIVVRRGGAQSVACTSDYRLSAALAKAVLS